MCVCKFPGYPTDSGEDIAILQELERWCKWACDSTLIEWWQMFGITENDVRYAADRPALIVSLTQRETINITSCCQKWVPVDGGFDVYEIVGLCLAIVNACNLPDPTEAGLSPKAVIDANETRHRLIQGFDSVLSIVTRHTVGRSRRLKFIDGEGNPFN